MSERINISSGAPWEPIAGYSRAVRVGRFIEVAGTTAVDAQGNFFAEGDAGLQTQYILKKIQFAIEQAGGKMSDVVRTRIFVTDREHMMEVAKVHGQFFGAHLRTTRPPQSMRMSTTMLTLTSISTLTFTLSI